MIKKTVLERFEEIKDLEVADEQGKTVKDILPYFCENVEQALQRLEAIDNANPSEALESLEEIRDFRYGENKLLVCQTEMYTTIKRALLKVQERENKKCLQWKDLTFSKEPTYIRAKLGSVRVTLKCWKEYSKEWCTVNFGNAPCNNMMFVYHGYDDETDTQTTIFDALGFIAESNNEKGSIDNEELD